MIEFENKIIEKIKENIGELMTNEDLSRIVHRAVEETFFKPVILKKGYHEVEKPPVIHQILEKLLYDSVSSSVHEYIKENNEVVNNLIKETLSKGFGTMLINSFSMMFQNELFDFRNQIEQKFKNL